jgi:leucine efflux protein
MAADLGLVNLPTYLLGTLIIVLLPGPNSLFVLGTAARHGVSAGYRAACGVFLGDTVLMVLASAGVASLLRTNPELFAVFKFSGAAYLAWIGVNLLRGAFGVRPADAEVVVAGQASPAAAGLTRRALVISLMNPKAILFFVAFFIQFVDRSYAHPALSFALLGLIAQTISFLYLSTLIFSGARLADAFRRRRRLSTGLTGSAGAMFLGFSAKLATATVN